MNHVLYDIHQLESGFWMVTVNGSDLGPFVTKTDGMIAALRATRMIGGAAWVLEDNPGMESSPALASA